MIVSSRRHITLALTGLILCLLWFEFTPTDIWLQNLLYDTDARQWIWSRAEPITRLIFYNGIKDLLIAFAVGLLLSLVFIRRFTAHKGYSAGIRIVLLSLILVPACIGVLKDTTNVACPRDLVQFGGNLEYAGITGRYAELGRPFKLQRCFPAGHASGGFALLSLGFLFQKAQNRRRAIYLALVTGWSMGIYKMLIGDHFLSHTVTTMLLAWLIIHLIVFADKQIFAESYRSPAKMSESMLS